MSTKNPLKKLVALILLALATSVYANEVALNPSHPDQYTVVEGDTLWGIAERFLRDPWRWPDVWHVNPQIANPHLIFPGDVVGLSYDKNGKPTLSVKRGRTQVKLSPHSRATPLNRAIPTIPLDAIRQFLLRPMVVSEGELEAAPYIVETADEHVVVGAGDRVYVRGVEGDKQRAFSVFRAGMTYRNPNIENVHIPWESATFDPWPFKGDKEQANWTPVEEILGYEAIFIGDARMTRPGDPSTFLMAGAVREVKKGDRLLPTDDQEFNQHFQPRLPAKKMNGVILNVVDGVSQIGRNNIVAISVGEREGAQVGDVLAVYRRGETIDDSITESRFDEVKLPDERAGVLMVFRVFDKVSFALVMKATRAINIHDLVHNIEE